MPRSNPETTAINLLSRFLKAMALGVLCAGFLLFDHRIDLSSVIIVRQQWLVRLIFLISIGISFGLGCTLAEVL